MDEKVLAIMKLVFGRDDLDFTCSQETCNEWDSMAQLNLVLELEDAFEISLEPEEIGEMTTFERVCKVLKEKLAIRS